MTKKTSKDETERDKVLKRMLNTKPSPKKKKDKNDKEKKKPAR